MMIDYPGIPKGDFFPHTAWDFAPEQVWIGYNKKDERKWNFHQPRLARFDITCEVTVEYEDGKTDKFSNT